MNGELYEIIALAMRYFFAGIMALVAVRAWKITIVDSRRAAELRRMSPETGVCGEFLVVTGDGRAREGMRYPVIREGLVGSSGKADVRLRSKSVRRSHAFFEMTDRGLRVRNNNRAPMYLNGKSRREALLRDGDHITVGRVELMLVLSVPVNAPADEKYDAFDVPSAPEEPVADLFETPQDAQTPRPEPKPRVYDAPTRPEPKPRELAPEKNDEFDSWLDMTDDDTWDAGAAPGWDDQWDDGPRKRPSEKRRIDVEDDDFFHV